MHYQHIIYKVWLLENGEVKNPVIFVGNVIAESNFFMHIFIKSITYLSSVKKFQ